MGYLDGFGITLRKWLGTRSDSGRRITSEYPEQTRPKPERFHGRHVLNRYDDGMEKCIGCELCAGVCPAQCIYVRGADNDPDDPTSPGERYGFIYEINYLRCIHCDLCVEACPTEAITETKLFEFAFTNRADAIYTKDELVVGDDGRPQQLPWENWSGGFDPAADTSGWMRATSPSGDEDFVDVVAWAGELGYGVRAPQGGGSVTVEVAEPLPAPAPEEPPAPEAPPAAEDVPAHEEPAARERAPEVRAEPEPQPAPGPSTEATPATFDAPDTTVAEEPASGAPVDDAAATDDDRGAPRGYFDAPGAGAPARRRRGAAPAPDPRSETEPEPVPDPELDPELDPGPGSADGPAERPVDHDDAEADAADDDATGDEPADEPADEDPTDETPSDETPSDEPPAPRPNAGFFDAPDADRPEPDTGKRRRRRGGR